MTNDGTKIMPGGLRRWIPLVAMTALLPALPVILRLAFTVGMPSRHHGRAG